MQYTSYIYIRYTYHRLYSTSKNSLGQGADEVPGLRIAAHNPLEEGCVCGANQLLAQVELCEDLGYTIIYIYTKIMLQIITTCLESIRL